MTSTDALIRDLSAHLAPVRRRRVWREAVALLAIGASELAIILMLGGMRPDMDRMILSSVMIWKIGSLALLATISCTVAIRSFAPPAASRRGVLPALGLAGLAMIGGALVTSGADHARSLMDRLSPAEGLRCAAAIVVLALPVLALLAVLMRRAAPAHPRRSAVATGLAASLFGALVFTVCCPMNDPLYIIAWYSIGVATVTALARWLLPRRFRL